MNIQEIKEKVGQEAERIISRDYSLEKKGKMHRCPNNTEHKNGDLHPSMSWNPEALHFYCFTCGKKIDIYDYYREYLNLNHKEIEAKLNQKPINKTKRKENNMSVKNNLLEKDLNPLNTNQKNYLESRGISKETYENFRLKMIKGNIALPYYCNGKVEGIKIKNLKDKKPKYFSVPGSQFGFFNKNNINEDENSVLIITEGEIDCMTLYQCGYSNVVSIGTGANALNKLLTKEKDFLEGFKNILLVSDNDKAGNKMDRYFLERLNSKVMIPDKNLYDNCKDINELYMLRGKSYVDKLIKSASRKLEGLRDLDKEPYKGLNTQGNFIPTGIFSIDEAINELAPGFVTLVTGRSNGGKTTLVRQITTNAIDNDNRVLYVSGEGSDEMFLNKLYENVIGSNIKYYDEVKVNRKIHKEPKPNILKKLQKWHKNKLFIFNKGLSSLKTTDELFNMLSTEVQINNHNLIVIDNLMSILHVARADEKLEAQADFVQRCCDLSKAEGIHIILVLHPNKSISKGQKMEFEAISGTSDIYNKADIIIAVTRFYDDKNITYGIDGELEVLKNRDYTENPCVKVHFNKENTNYYEIDNEGKFKVKIIKGIEDID